MSGWSDDDDDDDDNKKGEKGDTKFEFDCPSCNANNPWPDGFKDREEVNCHYCGTTLEARFADGSKLKLREV